MPIRFRRAVPKDIPLCSHLIVCDKPMLSPANWKRFPDMLMDLLERERISLVVIEEPATGRFRMLGGSAFVDARFLAQALAHPTDAILEQALTAEAQGQSVFLPPSRVAEANAKGELRLLNFLGVPVFEGMSGPEGNLMYGTINEAWRFHHYGFRLHSFYSECTHPQMAEFMRGMQCDLARERPVRDGEIARTFRFTREDALQKTGANIAFMFLPPLPRFDFSIPEQRLLEKALMDCSDREIAEALSVTPDAIKKRWRSIYTRMRTAAPELVPAGLGGADQRRQALQYLRQHLEEIRPFRRDSQTTPAG